MVRHIANMQRGWAEWHMTWTEPGRLILHYDDVVKDMKAAVGQVAEFLGVELSEAEAENVAFRSSLQFEKKHKRHGTPPSPFFAPPRKEDDHMHGLSFSDGGDKSIQATCKGIDRIEATALRATVLGRLAGDKRANDLFKPKSGSKRLADDAKHHS